MIPVLAGLAVFELPSEASLAGAAPDEQDFFGNNRNEWARHTRQDNSYCTLGPARK